MATAPWGRPRARPAFHPSSNPPASNPGPASAGQAAARALPAPARARGQLLTFAVRPGEVAATNTACERALRPSVIQPKFTNGYRAMWAAKGETDIRTVVDTPRLKPGAGVF